MVFNTTKLLFMTCLILGTLISISANSWLGVWMGLEINLMSFIPLMTNTNNIISNEAALKYFLIQAFASLMLLLSIILMNILTQFNFINYIPISLMMMSTPLLLKMGAAPFHFWFPGIMEGLSWMNCLLLMTWQKIAPLILISYTLKMNFFIYCIIITSIIIGSLGGLNQTSLRKLMAYSSISHIGWMISAMLTGENMWQFYLITYTFLTSSIILLFHLLKVYHINQNFLIMNNTPITKTCLFTLLLSLGGLPPFMGFLPKWLTIQMLVELKVFLITTMMVVMTLITLFFYLRMTFTAFLLSPTELKWINIHPNQLQSLSLTILGLTSISALGLLFSTMLFNML
uniref:NADH-ubiquinone oxidoreductase chain 2 n=1 Tax=Lipotactes tripyrga TaxID=948390 RepID=A0A1Q1MPV8_9ORTH|nr:NADH dehydrogenase subunit 2 [Lipotactes tripyrga]AQM40122.1 NADH dehydrogenase subunit 2 [Lipotactes tripyrga]